jgi:hypothetical protein
MEFYLNLLFDFCRLGDRFLGVYSRLKCPVAAKVRSFLFVMEMVFCIQFKDRACYPRFEDTYGSIVSDYFDLKYYR